jgi:hypothetical protein
MIDFDADAFTESLASSLVSVIQNHIRESVGAEAIQLLSRHLLLGKSNTFGLSYF